MKDIFTYVTLVKSGSYVKAAEVLRVSAATLTRKIQKLEQDLEVQLIKRNAKGLALTKFGQILFDSFSDINEVMNKTKQKIKSEQSRLLGDIKILISLSNSISNDIILDSLIKFSEKYPKICMTIDYLTREYKILEDKYDIVITDKLPSSVNQKCLKIFSSKLVLACSESYASLNPIPQSINDIDSKLIITNHNFPLNTLRSYKTGEIININLEKSVISTNNSNIASDLISRSSYFGVVPKYDIKKYNLVHVLPDFYCYDISYYLLRTGNFKEQKINNLIDTIKSELQNAIEN